MWRRSPEYAPMVLELANDLGWITTKIFESNMGGQPIFPPELERTIFELLVKDHPKSALPLMLVAARTHHWIVPTLYSVSNQLGKTYPPARTSKPSLQYYGSYVKHLIIGGDKSFHEICTYLSACPSLIDLALWSDCDTKKFIPYFNKLKLERLSTNLISLSLPDFQNPAFAHITHLDVTRAKWSHWQGLLSLPLLSHLAINEAVDVDILRQLLQCCNRLQIVLAVDRGNWHGWNCDWDTRSDIISNHRFIMMTICRYVVEDRVDSASGKENMWEWAEEISAAKKRKTFKEGGKLWTTWFDAYEKGWRDVLKKAGD